MVLCGKHTWVCTAEHSRMAGDVRVLLAWDQAICMLVGNKCDLISPGRMRSEIPGSGTAPAEALGRAGRVC